MSTIKYQLDFMASTCKWSPFKQDTIAVGTGKNFGFIGNGTINILNKQGSTLEQVAVHSTPDGVFDCAWSELNENHIAYGLGNGTVNIWDIKADQLLTQSKEHQAEVHAVQWNGVTRVHYLTASWDQTLKVWSPESSKSIQTYSSHASYVNACSWNPRYGDIFVSVGGDGFIKMWDVNDDKPALSWSSRQGELLAVEWDKYNPNQLYTGGTDSNILVWDVRNAKQPLKKLTGHDFGIKCIVSSPHTAGLIVSSSYDMSACIWDTTSDTNQALIGKYEDHTEFVFGLDFNNYVKGRIASASWDCQVHVWDINTVCAQWKRPVPSAVST